MQIVTRGRLAALAIVGATLALSPTASAQSDAQIKQRLIRQSIANYSGSCPCPYNVDRAGRRCGARSAYSRPGGAAPLCYASDVSAAQLRAARGR
ncbi:hypothetical protein [Allosphingosinicella sp.]|jgi:hypothetical protein|uniref:hypothetical protein n=1 Tax=Allosphingosinicella sp. TaxID=2823234 RepID=UPI002F0DA1A5